MCPLQVVNSCEGAVNSSEVTGSAGKVPGGVARTQLVTQTVVLHHTHAPNAVAARMTAKHVRLVTTWCPALHASAPYNEAPGPTQQSKQGLSGYSMETGKLEGIQQ